MRIAELYRNQACLEDLTSELPEGFEYDSSSECLRVTESFDESVSWGPFCFEIVASPTDAHLSVQTSDRTQAEVRLFVRLKVKGERWLMLLSFLDTADAASSPENDDDEEAGESNTAIVVNVRQQTLYLKAQRPLLRGERLTTRLSSDDGEEVITCGPDAETESIQHHGHGRDSSLSPQQVTDDIPIEDPEYQEVNGEEEEAAEVQPSHPDAARKRPASADGCSGGSSSAKLPRLQSSRRSAAQAESALRSRIRYCGRCGLFFTSGWMLQTHRQFHDLFDDAPKQLHGERSDSPQLVLSAPVLSDRGGISYVPVGVPRVSALLQAGHQQQQEELPEQQRQQGLMGSDADSSSSPTALDLTMPRAPTPQWLGETGAALSRMPHKQQQQPRQRIRQSQVDLQHQQQRQQQQQQQQEQQNLRKPASVSSLMSVCKDCKIGFFNYNNYVVHRSLYCQSSRLAAAAAASANSTPSNSSRIAKLQQQTPQLHDQQQQQQPPQPPTQSTPKLEAQSAPSALLAIAPASNHSPTAATERKFQCPYCQIRFHSPSTLTAHQAFYCPENPEKTTPTQATSSTSAASAASTVAAAPASTVPMTTVADVAAAAAAAAVTGEATASGGQQQQQQSQQQQPPPSWLPIPLDVSSGGGYKCSICGYIGQTERGMKMHAKVHSGFGVCVGGVNSGNGSSSSALSPSDASAGDGIRLPTSFPSDLLSSMTPEELGMLQHKTQPYSKRRTFKRIGPPLQPQQLQLPLSLHPDILRHQLHQLHQQHQLAISAGATAAAATSGGFRLSQCRRDSEDDVGQWTAKQQQQQQQQGQLVCVRCGESFDQLESLLEHQETACPGLNAAASAAAAAVEAAAAAVKLESVRAADSVSRV